MRAQPRRLKTGGAKKKLFLHPMILITAKKIIALENGK